MVLAAETVLQPLGADGTVALVVVTNAIRTSPSDVPAGVPMLSVVAPAEPF